MRNNLDHFIGVGINSFGILDCSTDYQDMLNMVLPSIPVTFRRNYRYPLDMMLGNYANCYFKHSKNELIKILDNFDKFVYTDICSDFTRIVGVPRKISKCENLTDEFKEVYHTMMKRIRPYSEYDNTFDGDVFTSYKI